MYRKTLFPVLAGMAIFCLSACQKLPPDTVPAVTAFQAIYAIVIPAFAAVLAAIWGLKDRSDSESSNASSASTISLLWLIFIFFSFTILLYQTEADLLSWPYKAFIAICAGAITTIMVLVILAFVVMFLLILGVGNRWKTFLVSFVVANTFSFWAYLLGENWLLAIVPSLSFLIASAYLLIQKRGHHSGPLKGFDGLIGLSQPSWMQK